MCRLTRRRPALVIVQCLHPSHPETTLRDQEADEDGDRDPQTVCFLFKSSRGSGSGGLLWRTRLHGVSSSWGRRSTTTTCRWTSTKRTPRRARLRADRMGWSYRQHGQRRLRPTAMSDAASRLYAPRGPAPHGPRQAASPSRAAPDGLRPLFAPRRDDPVRFSSLARPHASPDAAASRSGERPTPTPNSSGDYVPASSTSSASYAHSTLSSNFTLSSPTTDSSTPSGLFENTNARRSEDSSSSTNAFSKQVKKLDRAISELEKKILGEQRDKEAVEDGERNPQTVGILVKSRPGSGSGGGAEVRGAEDEGEQWKGLLAGPQEYVLIRFLFAWS